MDNIILKVELEGVKHSLAHFIGSRNIEFNEMILNSLDKKLSEEWIIAEIDKAVEQVIHQSISKITTDYRVESAIRDAISDAVVKRIKGE